MPASSIAQLLNYEGNYENAVRTYLAAQLTGVQVLTPETLLTDETILETPRVTVAFQLAGTFANQQANRTTDSAEYDAYKLGTLTLAGYVQRNNTSQSLQTLRGGVRKAMLAATAALNSNTLPYYQTVILREGPSQAPLAGENNDEIGFSQSYAVEFWIKPDQWAAS